VEPLRYNHRKVAGRETPDMSEKVEQKKSEVKEGRERKK
jgi:hypothetical protein